LQLIVGNPFNYPDNGRVIPTGQSVWVDVDTQMTYTVERVRRLRAQERGCLYQDEGSNMGLGGYMFHNCITECHLRHTLQYCNCAPYFYTYLGKWCKRAYAVLQQDGLVC
jgi:hypothetical protein